MCSKYELFFLSLLSRLYLTLICLHTVEATIRDLAGFFVQSVYQICSYGGCISDFQNRCCNLFF